MVTKGCVEKGFGKRRDVEGKVLGVALAALLYKLEFTVEFHQNLLKGIKGMSRDVNGSSIPRLSRGFNSLKTDFVLIYASISI